MRATIISVALLVLGTTTACGDKPQPPKKTSLAKAEPEPTGAAKVDMLPSGVRFEIGNRSGPCARTLCIGGPGEIADAPNRDLGELCRRTPGVVRRCEDERCLSVWTREQWQEGLDALITSLDVDADGQVGSEEASCRINVAGWSLGAAIATADLPKALREDPRVDEAHAVVQNLVAIVPHAPGRERIEVADNVRNAWIYRHTKTPEEDCSTAYEGGPWLSPAPVCGPNTRCWDYDYSLEPALAFIGRRGARSGSEVGHCDVVALVSKVAYDNLARGVEARAELLPRLSNGEPGGRVVHGPPKPDPIKLLDNPAEPD